ncbi:hypothetical protein WOLCODRAFT_143913 [Wolfiporia cocos MD-104 SS10]|uniref:Uncharacterized protein n=1 Tax=Wolfiporia cocos (strain MD-104) TaxID=742152 RepID=A0A2H3JWH1_WOLCO|nr:hypothetical protein WOLCODRAFT_143913 [Wolfiporia cocos MD-104 SS10]
MPSPIRPLVPDPLHTPTVSRATLHRALHSPALLSRLYPYLPWPALHALANTHRALRIGWLADPACAHVLLSHCIPGYADAARTASYAPPPIDIDFHDLALFMISQTVPLHRYPMHALAVLSSSSLSHVHLSEKYTALTAAHSRVVLLLQALVHSAPAFPHLQSQPHLPSIEAAEEEDDLPPLPLADTRFPRPAARELVFPAPLALSVDGHAAGSSTSPARSSSLHPRPQRTLSLSPTRASGDFSALLDRSHGHGGGTARRRMSFLAPKVPPPPPAKEPLASRYVASWGRRASTFGGEGARGSTYGGAAPSVRGRADSTYSALLTPPRMARDLSASASSDEDLKAPKRRFTATPRSSASSLREAVSADGASASSSSASTPNSSAASASACTSSTSASGASQSPPAAVPPRSSPHSLALALSRSRAPILRTFVPCATLGDAAASHCAAQLRAAGLWGALSVGDITYVWIARVRVAEGLGKGEGKGKGKSWEGAEGAEEVGRGWRGEWVLEGAGTREGRAALLRAMEGARARWAVVRERTGGGRVWLRLLEADVKWDVDDHVEEVFEDEDVANEVYYGGETGVPAPLRTLVTHHHYAHAQAY